MTRSPARFTQAEVTKPIRAGKAAGFECVMIEISPEGGLRATYSNAGSQPNTPNEWDVVFSDGPLKLRSMGASARRKRKLLADGGEIPVMTSEEVTGVFEGLGVDDIRQNRAL